MNHNAAVATPRCSRNDQMRLTQFFSKHLQLAFGIRLGIALKSGYSYVVDHLTHNAPSAQRANVDLDDQ